MAALSTSTHVYELCSSSGKDRCVVNIPLAQSPTSPGLSSASFPPPPSSPSQDSSLSAAPSPSHSPSPSPPLTRVQRQQRRAMKHRHIDANRRSKEASALAALEKSLGLPPHDPSIAETDNPGAPSSKPRKRLRSKAAVMDEAAARLAKLERLVAASQVYRQFFFDCSLQVCMFDPSLSRCVDVNDAYCHFTGYHRWQLLHSRLAMCPHIPAHLRQQREAPTERWSPLEQWEVDEEGREVPVAAEQLRWNFTQLQCLFSGGNRKVICVFRIALAGQRLMEAQCECWLTGEPLTAPESCDDTRRILVVQTTAAKYRSVAYTPALPAPVVRGPLSSTFGSQPSLLAPQEAGGW